MTPIPNIETNNAFFRQLVFVALLVFIGFVIFYQTQFFVGSFLGAITMYVVTRNAHFSIVGKWGLKQWISALLIVIVLTLLLAGIGYLIFEVTAAQLPQIDTSQIAVKFKFFTEMLNEKMGFPVLSHNILDQSSDVITAFLSKMLSTTYSFAANVFMMLVILYFMLANARRMEKRILLYQPFRGDSLVMIEREIKNMVYGNAVGIPVIMLGQGLTAWLVYWLFGFESPAFWAFLTALCGLIPMVGTALVFVPLGIYLVSSDQMTNGILLIAAGLVVIANIDNLIRILLMKKIGNTHPLVVIFGVILGIPLFGFWGIIFGPLLISGFLLLIKIYYREYGLISKRDVAKVKIEDRREERKR